MEREVIGYVRSAVIDDNNIVRQKNEINNYCNESGLGLNRIFEDNGASKSLNRDGLNQLFEFLQESKGGTKIIGFYKI